MKNKKKPEVDFTELEKINPVERQKILKDLLTQTENRALLKRISEEIIRAEIEEESLEKSLEEPKKEEDKREISGTNLDNLVERFAGKAETKEKEDKKEFGKGYGVDIPSLYEAYKVELYSHDHKQFNPEITTGDKVTTGIGEQDLSSNFAFKKMTELYNKKEKKEGHEHGH